MCRIHHLVDHEKVDKEHTQMTIEERFDRIEHVTAGLAEERRKDREEYRRLWRDTQLQLNELTFKIAETNDVVARLAEDTNAAIKRFSEEFHEADRLLGLRIESLVSAIGNMIREQSKDEPANVG